VTHIVVPFKVRVEAEEGDENPVYNTEDVCVLCEVGTEAKEAVEQRACKRRVLTVQRYQI